MKKSMLVVLVVIGFLTVGFVSAYAEVINFDALDDGEIVTTQFPGLTFSNTIVLTAGSSLNEFEFPPHSGSNVVSDNGGPITIMFATPMLGVGAYFTYLTKLTLSFFHTFDTADLPLGIATSAFDSNLALSGNTGSNPNEFLSFAWASGISSVVITGDASGSSFTMDDLTLTSVPEPATLVLLGCGIIGGIAFKRRFE